MRLDERQESILDFIVRDYTRTACPVSSHKISEKRKMDLSPASIRNIMLELDEEGFLHQSHTSAGRAPTKKGYEYFVDNLMKEKNISNKVKTNFDEILDNFFGEEQFEELTSLMSRELGLFSGIFSNGRIFKQGFAEVLREPEFQERDFLLEFAEFADHVEEKIEEFEGIKIGDFSVVSSKFKPNKIVFFVGPRRMDYEKAWSIIKFMENNL